MFLADGFDTKLSFTISIQGQSITTQFTQTYMRKMITEIEQMLT